MKDTRKVVALLIIIVLVGGFILFRKTGASISVFEANQVMDDTRKQPEPTKVIKNPQEATSSTVNNTNKSNNKIMKLEIKTTQEGTGERVVKNGDQISMLYTGKFLDGTVFDSSAKHGGSPFDFIIGKGMVIKGWDQGILGMKVGEKRTLMIPFDLAYGAQGYASIPPSADLIFDIELVAFK
jgi:FKBP-type peptidyl-prolyl cis-trans isomerase